MKNLFDSFIKKNNFNMMLNTVTILVFVLIVVVLVKTIVQIMFPDPVTPTNFDELFFEFMGLPYAFWVLLGVGIALGLAFHGFKIIHIETRK